MTNIVDKINKIEKLFHAKGCTDEQIKIAEKKLGFSLPTEYVQYVREFGAISFYATEWTGLNVGGRINVVDVTEQERKINSDFPKDCFVIENQGIDGIIIVADVDGKVFSVQYDKKELICNYISEYLEQCISRA